LISDGNVQAVALKRQWNRIRVADLLEIADYQRPGTATLRQALQGISAKKWIAIALDGGGSASIGRLLALAEFSQGGGKGPWRAWSIKMDSIHPFE